MGSHACGLLRQGSSVPRRFRPVHEPMGDLASLAYRAAHPLRARRTCRLSSSCPRALQRRLRFDGVGRLHPGHRTPYTPRSASAWLPRPWVAPSKAG